MLPDAEASRQAVTDKLSALRGADLTVSYQIRHGEPTEEIILQATESKADLIVMGTHGREGLARFMGGSVAEDVLRAAPCPVVTVRMPSQGTDADVATVT